MKKLISGIVAIGLSLSIASVVTAEEITYKKNIKPIFDANCASCHAGNSAPEHSVYKEEAEKWKGLEQGMKMDTYSYLVSYTAWPQTGALMRRLNDGKDTKDGKPGNMYEYLGATNDERQKNLQIIKEWVGNWTLKRWKDVSKEELDGIKVKY